MAAALGMVSCANNPNKNTSNTSNAGNQQHAEAALSGTFPDTTVTGTVRFDEQSGGNVRLTLQVTVPSRANKSVAVHIHEHGDCGDVGKHAGGHWNPTGANHGKWGSGSFHSGDIGNINLDASGNGRLELSSNLWSIGGDAKTDILSKTIIVHSGVDDYTSQPAGNSGNRIGCGVIQRKSS
ncbi:MAG: superoxide dismutase family protein [Flavisolibacter sp.]|nr:superoxide dismutase family protein [Flavisolibacter sp.]